MKGDRGIGSFERWAGSPPSEPQALPRRSAFLEKIFHSDAAGWSALPPVHVKGDLMMAANAGDAWRLRRPSRRGGSRARFGEGRRGDHAAGENLLQLPVRPAERPVWILLDVYGRLRPGLTAGLPPGRQPCAFLAEFSGQTGAYSTRGSWRTYQMLPSVSRCTVPMDI